MGEHGLELSYSDLRVKSFSITATAEATIQMKADTEPRMQEREERGPPAGAEVQDPALPSASPSLPLRLRRRPLSFITAPSPQGEKYTFGGSGTRKPEVGEPG